MSQIVGGEVNNLGNASFFIIAKILSHIKCIATATDPCYMDPIVITSGRKKAIMGGAVFHSIPGNAK